MSKDDETKLPPLPEDARSAIQAFRAERPSPQARFRIHAALQAAESPEPSPRPPPPPKHARWRSSAGLRVALGAVLTGALMLGVTVNLDGDDARLISLESLPSRHVSFQLPAAGIGWVERPWSIGEHPEGKAVVHMETPAEMNFHEHHAEHLPALQLVSCEGNRCLHQFEAPSGSSAQPLRVRIHKPGRYEFRSLARLGRPPHQRALRRGSGALTSRGLRLVRGMKEARARSSAARPSRGPATCAPGPSAPRPPAAGGSATGRGSPPA